MAVNTTAQRRPLSTIASDIYEDWGAKLSPHAAPYVEAMSTLNLITDDYYQDSAESVVLYFLSNATGWRGETARTVKAELRAMVGQ